MGTYGIPAEAAARILGIKEHYDRARGLAPDPVHQAELHDKETAEIFEVLAAHVGALEAYRRNTAIADDEFQRLRRLATAGAPARAGR